MTGQFLVLDGPDGSGTTLHARLLSERLREAGKAVLLTAEPSDGPIGKFIRQALHAAESLAPAALQLLFTADRADHLERSVLPALQRGEIVVCDRYTHSTVSYGEALGLDAGWLTEVNAHFPHPNATFFLLPPPEVCLERLARRASRDPLETADLQRRVHASYHRIAVKDPSIRIIDTTDEKEKTADLIFAAVHSMR